MCPLETFVIEVELRYTDMKNATAQVAWEHFTGNTAMPRLTKIIRSGITFVSRNLR